MYLFVNPKVRSRHMETTKWTLSMFSESQISDM